MRKYILSPKYTTGYCIVCKFMDEYINSLSIREYARSGLMSCYKCELAESTDEYVHNLCSNLTDDHTECESNDHLTVTTSRYPFEKQDIWYIEDILTILLYYTNEDKDKARELLSLFLKDKNALWTA